MALRARQKISDMASNDYENIDRSRINHLKSDPSSDINSPIFKEEARSRLKELYPIARNGTQKEKDVALGEIMFIKKTARGSPIFKEWIAAESALNSKTVQAQEKALYEREKLKIVRRLADPRSNKADLVERARNLRNNSPKRALFSAPKEIVRRAKR